MFGKRSGYTLLSEQRLHRQLSDDGRFAGANEWYFDLNHILNVLYSLYTELFIYIYILYTELFEYF